VNQIGSVAPPPLSVFARMRRLAAGIVIRLIGWRAVGERPAARKFVLIAAPHTSNWDLPMMLLFAMYFGIWPRWLGKKELFDGRFKGWAMRLLGGLPVDRSGSHALVAQTAQRLRQAETELIIAVPPEGTRSYRDHWKSGFYYIAGGAGVPIACSFLDWGAKQGGFGPTLMPSGNLKADMDRMRAIYGDKVGKFPGNTSTIRLREEEAAA